MVMGGVGEMWEACNEGRVWDGQSGWEEAERWEREKVSEDGRT